LERPTQAVILAGGKGTRLLPMTQHRPKPMVEIHGKPFLQYLIELVRDQGFDRILLLLGYLPEKITDYFGDGRQFGVRIDYSVSDPNHLTGRRLFLAKSLIDSHFLLMYCDNYLPFSFQPMWKYYQELGGSAALMTAYSNLDRYSRNNLRIEDDNRVSLYDKDRQLEHLNGVDIAFMLTPKQTLDLIPDENCSFEHSVYPELVARRQLYAWLTDHRYYSVTNQARLALTQEFLRRQPTVILLLNSTGSRERAEESSVAQWPTVYLCPEATDALESLAGAGFRLILCSKTAPFRPSDVPGTGQQPRPFSGLYQRGDTTVFACSYESTSAPPGRCITDLYATLLAAQRELHLDLSRTTVISQDEAEENSIRKAGCPWVQITAPGDFTAVAQTLTGYLAQAAP